jgi:Sortilin, neurotensin receptor 3,/BNR/Asp-box repeat
MDVGLQISRDGGKSWEHSTRGTPGRGHAWCIVPDPGKNGRVFLTIGQDWGQQGGIYRSDDKGRTWKRIGLKNAKMGRLQSVVIDLKSPVDKRTIYIGSQKNGIYRSVDGGDSWKNITPNFSRTAKNITSIALSPKSRKIIYAGTVAGLFVSKNAGKSWTQLGKGKFEKIENISICQSEPLTLYLCAHHPGKNGSWGQTELWRSTDAGKTFTNITPAYFKYAGAIAVNPYNKNYLYACNNLFEPLKKTQKMWIVRSKDGGKTWDNIGGDINSNRARHLTIDPKDPRKFFILTRFAIIAGIDENAPMRHDKVK